MFDPTTWYRVGCDAPSCIRTLMDDEGDQPLLIDSPDLDRIPAGYATDADGAPWELWAERNRAMCPAHGHLLQDEKTVAATHDPLF
ncbi:hypothetical protein [Nocardiopsis sp. JB363]|uniref:hypothetical protein n=1 Tax=Nocardiopsis sp. JB363 TaxID=1434837 RepID=UPI00097B1FF2|nr:hypothetical protein [Nocardiopsis sp. JB363]SIO84631.1 hypothetical protein BQ8420_02885 [Nocardiopsis sp. JB363]